MKNLPARTTAALTLLGLSLAPAIAWAATASVSPATMTFDRGALVDGYDTVVNNPGPLLALLAAGVWGGRQAGKALWCLPLAAVVGLLAAAAMGARLNIPVPSPERLAMVALVITGAIAALVPRMPLVVSVAFAALVGACQGFTLAGPAHAPIFWAGLTTGALFGTAGGVGLTSLSEAALSLGAPRLMLALIALGGLAMLLVGG